MTNCKYQLRCEVYRINGNRKCPIQPEGCYYASIYQSVRNGNKRDESSVDRFVKDMMELNSGDVAE